ncbi:ANTAR domain-containing protein [Nakamurella sp. YIM 132087]|uniref:ANTAR domain-containing protein n=1 Tax=Nakamurella alba TaxID=2665158 RepID=A0A7K1FMM0_9ACTN|nr:GAF and ANTAR domain-containing protein [Nakamurella alba]MTD14569.1 ANTAR domain-containing protein [Nakamurella alba]
MSVSREVPRRSGDPATVFAGLAEIIYDYDDFDQIHGALCAAAPMLVPGCDHASMMLRRGSGFQTVAASDETARTVDMLEQRHGEGPCVDAIVDENPQLDPDLTISPTWPTLAADVLALTPVRSVAGFRLRVNQDKVGALNVFSDTAGGLDEESVHHAIMLTAFASVALLAAHQRHQASSLRLGLESNREIGKAVGLLMAFHKVGEDQAFEMLRTTSQQMNLKIADVAREVLDHERSRSR